MHMHRSPFGFDHTLTVGVVSGLNREVQSVVGSIIPGGIQTDAAINPGVVCGVVWCGVGYGCAHLCMYLARTLPWQGTTHTHKRAHTHIYKSTHTHTYAYTHTSRHLHKCVRSQVVVGMTHKINDKIHPQTHTHKHTHTSTYTHINPHT